MTNPDETTLEQALDDYMRPLGQRRPGPGVSRMSDREIVDEMQESSERHDRHHREQRMAADLVRRLKKP